MLQFWRDGKRYQDQKNATKTRDPQRNNKPCTPCSLQVCSSEDYKKNCFIPSLAFSLELFSVLGGLHLAPSSQVGKLDLIPSDRILADTQFALAVLQIQDQAQIKCTSTGNLLCVS